MGAADKPKSVLVGFSVCPLCGGKTHVKRIDAAGKRPYSHCLDEHDKGCSHTHYATNAQQEALMLGKTRPLKSPTPSPTQEPAPEPAPPAPSPAPTPSPTPASPAPSPAPVKRRAFFDV